MCIRDRARAHPDREVVLFAIGFETTAPANAMAVQLADRAGLTNFSVLVSHVLVPPAITALMEAPDRRVQGFLAAGHVCTVEIPSGIGLAALMSGEIPTLQEINGSLLIILAIFLAALPEDFLRRLRKERVVLK